MKQGRRGEALVTYDAVINDDMMMILSFELFHSLSSQGPGNTRSPW